MNIWEISSVSPRHIKNRPCPNDAICVPFGVRMTRGISSISAI